MLSGVPECFLAKLLADQAKGKLSHDAVQQLALEMLLAGTDTSSISLYYLLMAQLADDRHLEQQLLSEVLQAAGRQQRYSILCNGLPSMCMSVS